MQAGAMNLPCIVTDINGCNEIIVENQNGIIIPVKEEKAIFEAMNNLVSNGEMLRQMQQKAREMIVSRYEQQVVWKAIEEEYKMLAQHV
jgi:glycosyltransferase involved in cell wall biosynthesis